MTHQPEHTELRRLLGEATPGEWELQDGCSWRRIGTREHDGNVLCPTKCHHDGHPDLTAGRGEDLYANLRLIVAMHSALPALLDRVEALEWFGARKNLSLDFHYEELEGDGVWTVHRISGNINDREWEIVGQGETPFDAIQAAARALSPTTPEATDEQ